MLPYQIWKENQRKESGIGIIKDLNDCIFVIAQVRMFIERISLK